MLLRPLLRWTSRIVLGLLVLAAGAFVVTAVRVWHAGTADSHPRSDVILVEGAAQYDGRPSAVFEARLAHGLELFRAGVAPALVTVGGRRTGDRFTEAGAGRSWFLAHGVPPGSVTAVELGSDTLLSLRAAVPVLAGHRWHSVVLVTDPWHELRSRAIARDLGLQAESSPVRAGPWTRGLVTQARYVGRESVAYLYYRVFGGASRAGPPAV